MRALWKIFCGLWDKFLHNGEGSKVIHRRVVIVPSMVDKIYQISNGKELIKVTVKKEMVGHRFGEFVRTRYRGVHKVKKKRK